MPDERNTHRPDEQDSDQKPEVSEGTAGVYNTIDYLASSFDDEDIPADDDTADMPVISDEAVADSRADGTDSRAKVYDRHELPTLPILDAPDGDDPKRTLPGSGGFDPNPDFFSAGEAVESGYTVPHIVPFQHTLVHVPPDKQGVPPAQQTIQAAAVPPAAQPQASSYRTQPNPAYPPAQPAYAPPAYPQQPRPAPQNPGGVPAQGKLPPRKTAKRRTILGCSPGCAMVLAVFGTFCGGLTLITLVLTATLGARLEEQLSAQVASVDDYRNFESTFYYDRNGTLLYEAFGEGRRTNVAYEQFPQDLINATVAIEDDSFFVNPGFEVQATMRAFMQYVGLAEGESGGSTITQQLVRGVLFDYEYRSERSVQRKVEEILLAILLTNRKSKPEILEMYLNEIYYGNLAYGAQAAAQVLFSKDVGQLTLGEAALLAGLPQAPANLDPLNPDPAVQQAVDVRWRTVLDRMVQENFITDAQRDEALAQGYTFNTPDVPLRAPHFTVFARQELESLMTDLGYTPEDVARGGLQVYTTVDLDINAMALEAAQSQVASLAGNNVTNAAVLVLKPQTGEILAMIGSVDYNNESIDGNVNVTVSPRQPGSTMKPFTYSAAMEMGFTPGDIIWDTPTDIGGYVPRNYDGAFHGPVRLRTALSNSYNIPAVQTVRSIGVENLLAIMQRFGVESLGMDASQYGVSLTLGGGEVSLLEMTRAYTVFANGGTLVPSTAILCVLDSDDNIVYQYENSCPSGNSTNNTVNRAGFGQTVLDPRIAFIMSDVLSDNVARSPAMGANSPLNTGEIASSVKTGTTNDVKDNWTIGFTRNVAVGVWVGNTRGEAMVNSSGLTGAAPIWNSVITRIYNDPAMLNDLAVEGQLQQDRPEPPSGMSLRNMCDISSLRDPVTDCSASVREWFLDGPAGIPDGAGGLQFPQGGQQVSDAPPATGPWLREVEPDIYRVLVQPIPPEIGNQIQFSMGAGQSAPPAPLYCQVPVEAAGSAPGAREQLFIAPPQDPADAVRAEQYARSGGYAFLPTIACDANLLSVAPMGSSPIVITALITSPTPNQVVSGAIPILGTVQFSPEQALYYKVEISGGQFGGDWVTVGNTHGENVVNGQLEALAGLQPGSYQVRLVVVGHDGNFVQTPYTVPFIVQ